MYTKNDYFWQGTFTALFVILLAICTWIIVNLYNGYVIHLRTADIIIIALATFRIIRLIIYDKVAAFVRAIFLDAHVANGETHFVPKASGPLKTVGELLQCPWCFGIWAAMMVIFFYLLSPIFYIPILMLAVAGVATMMQITANLIGWKAEHAKDEATRHKQ